MNIATGAEDDNPWPVRIEAFECAHRRQSAQLPDRDAVRAWLWPKRGFWLQELWTRWRTRTRVNLANAIITVDGRAATVRRGGG